MIGILDTSFSSDNLGDHVIVDSLTKYVPDLSNASSLEIIRSSSHDGIGRCSKSLLKKANLILVTGGNSVPVKWLPWRRNILNLSFFKDAATCRKKIIFLGSGLENYPKWNAFSTVLFNRVFCMKDGLNSVRDTRTADFLKSRNLDAIFTGCPTTWGFYDKSFDKPDHLKNLIVTINPHRSEELSRRILKISSRSKFNTIFWAQHQDDIYFYEKCCKADSEINSINKLKFSLSSYDKAIESLDTSKTAYFGLRLHGGMRAMQSGIYSMIGAVDNRASDMLGDIDIPTFKSISREDDIYKFMSDHPTIKPDIPIKSIENYLSWLTKIIHT